MMYDRVMKCRVLIGCAVLILISAAAQSGVLAQKNIRVEYHADDLEVAQQSMEVLNQAVNEFSKRLPMGEAPIRVIIAHSYDEFLGYASRFSQLSVTGIAKPREGFIVVKGPRLQPITGDYPGTLRHELVHILLYRNANPDAIPPWLNEGIAMSLANEHHWDSLFTMARLFMTGRLIDYRKLEFAFLAPGDEMEFGEAYAQGLSMTRFLRRWVGEENFWKIVFGTKEMSFADALQRFAGKSLTEFWDAYVHSLWFIALLASLASGSFFAPVAVLLVIAYIRKHFASRRIIARMAAEEAEESALGIHPFSWEEVVEDPDAWKGGTHDEEHDSWRHG